MSGRRAAGGRRNGDGGDAGPGESATGGPQGNNDGTGLPVRGSGGSRPGFPGRGSSSGSLGNQLPVADGAFGSGSSLGSSGTGRYSGGGTGTSLTPGGGNSLGSAGSGRYSGGTGASLTPGGGTGSSLGQGSVLGSSMASRGGPGSNTTAGGGSSCEPGGGCRIGLRFRHGLESGAGGGGDRSGLGQFVGLVGFPGRRHCERGHECAAGPRAGRRRGFVTASSNRDELSQRAGPPAPALGPSRNFRARARVKLGSGPGGQGGSSTATRAATAAVRLKDSAPVCRRNPARRQWRAQIQEPPATWARRPVSPRGDCRRLYRQQPRLGFGWERVVEPDQPGQQAGSLDGSARLERQFGQCVECRRRGSTRSLACTSRVD